MVRTTSALLRRCPSRRRGDLELARRYRMCGERPARGGADDDDAHHEQQQDGRAGARWRGDVREVEQHVAERSRKSSQASGMSSRTASLRSRALRRASGCATSASLPARPAEDGGEGAVQHRRIHGRRRAPAVGMRAGIVGTRAPWSCLVAHLPSRRIAFHRRAPVGGIHPQSAVGQSSTRDRVDSPDSGPLSWGMCVESPALRRAARGKVRRGILGSTPSTWSNIVA